MGCMQVIVIMPYIRYVLYNGQIWRGLNLVNPSSEHIGKFLIWRRVHDTRSHRYNAIPQC